MTMKLTFSTMTLDSAHHAFLDMGPVPRFRPENRHWGILFGSQDAIFL